MSTFFVLVSARLGPYCCRALTQSAKRPVRRRRTPTGRRWITHSATSSPGPARQLRHRSRPSATAPTAPGESRSQAACSGNHLARPRDKHLRLGDERSDFNLQLHGSQHLLAPCPCSGSAAAGSVFIVRVREWISSSTDPMAVFRCFVVELRCYLVMPLACRRSQPKRPRETCDLEELIGAASARDGNGGRRSTSSPTCRQRCLPEIAQQPRRHLRTR